MGNRFGSFPTPADMAAQVARLIDRDIYNWKDSNTRRLQRSMAAAWAGSGRSDQVFIGDGQTYQRNVTTWPILLRNRLAATGIPIAGTGWIFSNDGYNNYDTRITKTGTWTIPVQPIATNGAGFTTATSSGATMVFASNLPGTIAEVCYRNDSGEFSVAVDVGSPVTVTPTGAAGIARRTITGLSDVNHTLGVTTLSASPTHICGFRVGKAAGLELHTLAGFGWQAEGFYSNPGVHWPSNIIKNMLPDGPDVVHAAFGMGDVYSNRTPAQVANNLSIIRRNYFPNSDFIIYAGMEPSGKDLSLIARQMYEVADTLDCPLVNVFQRAGSFTEANANGLMVDNFYPTPKGHHLWALLAAEELPH